MELETMNKLFLNCYYQDNNINFNSNKFLFEKVFIFPIHFTITNSFFTKIISNLKKITWNLNILKV